MKREKKAVFLTMVSLCTLLSGCSFFVEESYSSVTPHTITPISEGAVISVGSYYELVNGLLYYVTKHEEVGQIRLVNYEKERAISHMTEAVAEVLTETALGSFGVDSVNWEINSILGTLEANIEIIYKKTQEDYDSILHLNGITSMTRVLTQHISEMGGGLVMQNSYASTDRSQVSRMIHQAFSGAAGTVVEMPQISTVFYPKEGPWRIVEISFNYALGVSVRVSRQSALANRLHDSTSSLWALGDIDLHQVLLQNLWKESKVNDYGMTPYDVLVKRSGNARGFALAYLALCQEMGLQASVVEGTRDGEVYYWNLIALPTGSVHHVDILAGTGADGSFPYYSDVELQALGYSWNETTVLSATTYG